MTKFTPDFALSETEPDLFKKLAWLKRGSLAVVILIAVITLAAWIVPGLGRILPDGWQLMKAETGFAALFGALSLWLSEPHHSIRMHRLSMLFAGLTAFVAAAVLIEYGFHVSVGFDALFFFNRGSSSPLPGRMSPQSATAFLLLGAELILVRARKRFSSHVADAIILCLGMLVLTLVSGYLFGALRVFGLSASTPTSPQTLFCLLLLTQVALFRRAEHGLYSILLWRGIGGRIARTLSPVLLALPFLREATRAHFISSSRMPSHYVTAILASLAATLSFALLLLLSWYIHGMEVKIRDLSLRDELTGLYNLRGFSLFAEQALLMAHRSSLPFSVLFIDLDNLKQTNDSLGHSAGSALLSETGKILNASFRKTDVVGRIGGDEFAVAGQLSEAAISAAAQRLREAVAFRDSSAGLGHALTLSIGHFTSEEDAHYTLNELLSKADKAMYEEKSGKKPRAD